jgi:hypothetical protein
MLQDIHLPDVSDNFYNGHVTNTLLQFKDNDIDAVLIESTSVESDCSDFGSHALHQEDVPFRTITMRTTALCQEQRN